MQSFLLTILCALSFVGVICVFFANGRSLSKSMGGICAILIACVLSYQLFLPLSEGVSIHRLTPQILMLAFLPLAVLLIFQAGYYGVQAAKLHNAQNSAKSNSADEKEANTAFAKKNKKTGRDRLEAMLPNKEPAKPEIQEKDKQPDIIATVVETEPIKPDEPQVKHAGHERLEAMLKTVGQEQADKPEEEENDDDTLAKKTDSSDDSATAAEADEKTEDKPEKDQEGKRKLSRVKQNKVSTAKAKSEQKPEPQARVSDGADKEGSIVESEEQASESAASEAFAAELPAILQKADKMKTGGGYKLALALYDEYLKSPASDELQTKALSGKFDCHIALKQKDEAQNVANMLSERLDAQGVSRMNLLIKLLNR